MSDSSRTDPKINPELRERLLTESQNPLRGLRRLLWLAFLGSGFIGLFVMASRFIAGSSVRQVDVVIQLGAVVLFGYLLWVDRGRQKSHEVDTNEKVDN